MRRARPVLLILGLAVVAGLVARLGWQELLSDLVTFGPWLGAVLPLALGWHVCHAQGWRIIQGGLGRALPLGTALRLVLVGQGLNVLIPTANLGGEAARATLIRRRIPLRDGAPGVLADKVLDHTARGLFTAGALAVGLSRVPVPPGWARAGWIGTGLLLTGLAGLVVLQVLGLFRTVRWMARPIPALIRRLEERGESLDRADRNLRQLYLHRPLRPLAALGCHLVGRLLGTLELWLILRVLGAPVSPAEALLVSALANLAGSLAFLVPGQWGVAEGIYVASARLLGYPGTVGLSLGLIRRLRRLLLAGAGLILLPGSRLAPIEGAPP